MTCAHGFIGACAECDGAGQRPDYADEETRVDPEGDEAADRFEAANYGEGVDQPDETGAAAFLVRQAGRVMPVAELRAAAQLYADVARSAVFGLAAIVNSGSFRVHPLARSEHDRLTRLLDDTRHLADSLQEPDPEVIENL